MRSKEGIAIAFLTIFDSYIIMSEKINHDFCRMIKTNEKSIFNNLVSYLDRFYEGSTILVTSTLANGKIEKKRGFYRSPVFLFPPESFINFNDIVNDYEFVCIAIKKKKVIDDDKH